MNEVNSEFDVKTFELLGDAAKRAGVSLEEFARNALELEAGVEYEKQQIEDAKHG